MVEKLNANGHRRRQVRARVLAEEDACALCGQLVDKTVPYPDAMSAVVDEDIPRIRGGSQYDRQNTVLMHSACNRWKWKMTLAEAKAKLANDKNGRKAAKTVVASPIW